MEERVPPTLNHSHNHNHNHNDDEEFTDANGHQQEHHHHRCDDDGANNNGMLQIVPSSRDDSRETYIIQIPKDQIYRVPPPENAKIVERYRRPVTTNKKKRTRCAYWFFSIFFITAFIISVIFCVHHFTLNPKPPTFSIQQLVLKPAPPPSKKGASPGFHVRVDVANPNKVNSLEFQPGTASLLFKQKELAKGKFPTLDKEDPRKSEIVEVALSTSSKGGLPKELQTDDGGTNNSRGKKKNDKKPVNVNFTLTLNVPVKMETWLGTKNKNVNVECEFEVDTLGEHSKILSQKCHL